MAKRVGILYESDEGGCSYHVCPAGAVEAKGV